MRELVTAVAILALERHVSRRARRSPYVSCVRSQSLGVHLECFAAPQSRCAAIDAQHPAGPLRQLTLPQTISLPTILSGPDVDELTSEKTLESYSDAPYTHDPAVGSFNLRFQAEPGGSSKVAHKGNVCV